MKKVYCLLFLFFVVVSFQASEWTCVSDSDCSQAMNCVDELCRMKAGQFSDYATVEIKIGEHSPSQGGSTNIVTPHPASNLVLGQFEISARQSGADGKYFLFREMEALVASSTNQISGSNFRLIYDVNGNGRFDGSDIIISNGQAGSSRVKFTVDQKNATYLMNVANNFLVVGDFEHDGPIDSIKPFGLELDPSSDFVLRNQKDLFIVSNQKTVFPRYVFEPDKNYFIFTSGEHFPKPPKWEEMNGMADIMHLRMKSVDGSNELKTFPIRVTQASAKFGHNIKSVSLYFDKNGDGKGDELIVKKSFSDEDELSFTSIQIPEGKLFFSEGEEKKIVVTAELFLYNGQTVQFNISDKEPGLQTKMMFAGLPVTTQVYRYSCDVSDPLCNVFVEEVEEVEESGGGCSILNL